MNEDEWVAYRALHGVPADEARAAWRDACTAPASREDDVAVVLRLLRPSTTRTPKGRP